MMTADDSKPRRPRPSVSKGGDSKAGDSQRARSSMWGSLLSDTPSIMTSLLATEIRIDDEGLFARDVEGQLVRVEEATASELNRTVTITIDGQQVTVPLAVPQRDSQGKILRDAGGEPIPRPTTIHDADAVAFVKRPGQQHPIPTLCHQEHLPPVGVCRVCVVEATEVTRRGPRSKLVPSCIQRVTEGMVVNTVASQDDKAAAERVRAATSTIVELLMADHAPRENSGQSLAATAKPVAGNELVEISQR